MFVYLIAGLIRYKEYIYNSFFVPWCLSGRMEKVLSKKQNSILSNERF